MNLARDLVCPRVIVAKGLLFVVLGVLATGVLIAQAVIGGEWWLIAALHLLGVWAFCRAYYFAFYVIGKYVDPGFRFAGLGSAVRWMMRTRIERE